MSAAGALLTAIMNARPVDIVGLHVETTTGAPLVLLREHDLPHRVLPIFIGGSEAASIALALSGEKPQRPLAHDLMAAIVTSLDSHVDSVEVTAVVDGAFTAQLTLSGPSGGHRLDTRPSDAIALAIRLGTPLYVNEDVLAQAGSLIEDLVEDTTDLVDNDTDDEAIERDIADFRLFLDGIDASDFDDEDPDD